jgi:hypothetical protein
VPVAVPAARLVALAERPVALVARLVALVARLAALVARLAEPVARLVARVAMPRPILAPPILARSMRTPMRTPTRPSLLTTRN